MTNKELIQRLLEFPLHMDVRVCDAHSLEMNNESLGNVKIGMSPLGDHVILVCSEPFFTL